ncbi:MAG: UxaA family hydrolase [Deltaproteobacteria bacterium]|nr:UxaA family hydrolase [Deltaproteobacteria bacterium]
MDLKEDKELIAQYVFAHERIWPELAKNISLSGVIDMQIWRLGTRLFMIMDVDDSFSFEKAQVAEGCNLVLFSTGLGTPTGDPIVPVLKVSTNTLLSEKLPDLIDFDCGPILDGEPLEEVASALMEQAILAASGDYIVKAECLEQYYFMLWKRSVDL